MRGQDIDPIVHTSQIVKQYFHGRYHAYMLVTFDLHSHSAYLFINRFLSIAIDTTIPPLSILYNDDL